MSDDEQHSRDSDSRETDLDRMLQYQQKELDDLCARMTILDQQIATLERHVAHNTNVMSAARGLVGMRRGYQPPAVKDLHSSSRSRPKQRCWSKADGSLAHPSQDSIYAPSLHITPVGIIYTHFQKRFEAPRQSFTGATGHATILISDVAHRQDNVIAANMEALKPGMRVWLMYWFDRNSGQWRNFIRPPRAKGGWRVGVFATRSPNRPSPIGLSLANIQQVDIASRTLVVSGVDILDETPLIGFKGYNPESDAHPLALSGWLDDTNSLQPLYYDPVNHTGKIPDVVFSDSASAKIDFLDARSAADVRLMVQESLKRRVSAESEIQTSDFRDRRTLLAVGSFRITYEIRDEAEVVVTDVVSGMRPEVCEAEASSDPEVRVHMDFQHAFLNYP